MGFRIKYRIIRRNLNILAKRYFVNLVFTYISPFWFKISILEYLVILKLNIINYINCILDIRLPSWSFVPFRFLGFRDVGTVWIFVKSVGFFEFRFCFRFLVYMPRPVVVSPLIHTVLCIDA